MKESKIKGYKELRKAMGWSREVAAAELGMSDDKLERIENGKQIPNPQDALIMSEVYKSPELCNYYCNHECEIGMKYVPEIPPTELPGIIINLLNSANLFEDMEDRLIRITADEKIDDSEIPELIKIQTTLEQLSIMTEALQLCVERKLDNGEINLDIYNEELSRY